MFQPASQTPLYSSLQIHIIYSMQIQWADWELHQMVSTNIKFQNQWGWSGQLLYFYYCVKLLAETKRGKKETHLSRGGWKIRKTHGRCSDSIATDCCDCIFGLLRSQINTAATLQCPRVSHHHLPDVCICLCVIRYTRGIFLLKVWLQ